MNEKVLIKRAMKEKKVTQEELAKLYGWKSQGTVSNMFGLTKSIRTDVMTRVFDLLGYDVIVVDKESGEKIGRITSKITAPKVHKKKEEQPKEQPKAKKEIPVFQYGK